MNIIVIIFGLTIVIFGVIGLFKRIFIHRLYLQLLLWLILTVGILRKNILAIPSHENATLYYLICISILLAYIFISIHKYSVFMVDIDDIKKIIISFLDDNAIKYELKGEEITLNEMEGKILINDHIDGVEINLKAIRKTDLYYKIIKKVKKEIPFIPYKGFSFGSIIYILLGIFLIIIGL